MRELIVNKKVLDGYYALVVTTNDSERKAVRHMLNGDTQLSLSNARRRAYLGIVKNLPVLVLDGSGGFSDANAASRFAIEVLENPYLPRPALVVICGVCWGNPNKVKVGDVIVSPHVTSLNRSTLTSEGDVPTPYTYQSTLNFELNELDTLMGVKLGQLLSFESRVTSSPARERFLQDHPLALGGEMEGFAVIPTCAEKGIPWLLVKGVSDFAEDDCKRESQASVATSAARALRSIVCMQQSSHDDDDKTLIAEQRLAFAHTLQGRDLILDRSNLDMNSLKESIEKNLLPLRSRIDFYTSASAVSKNLPEHTAGLLLEYAMNAFGHTEASRAHIKIVPTGIEYSDDGPEYDIAGLTTERQQRGGSAAWIDFKNEYLDTAKVTWATLDPDANAKNRFRIEIPVTHDGLRDAKAHCKAMIDTRPASLRNGGAVQFHESCTEIFIDCENLVMRSRAFDICDELPALLAKELRVFIVVDSPTIAQYIKEKFQHAIEEGKIVLLPSA